MKPIKIFGWILLISGLLIIFYSLFISYNIFTGKSLAPAVFKVEEKEETVLPQKERVQDPRFQLEGLLEEKLQEQLGAIMPADYLPKLLNLISWSIFAGILIFGGSQISSLGIKLLKK
jgi:hypothetical protein